MRLYVASWYCVWIRIAVYEAYLYMQNHLRPNFVLALCPPALGIS